MKWETLGQGVDGDDISLEWYAHGLTEECNMRRSAEILSLW
jgi:hypothetical protein